MRRSSICLLLLPALAGCTLADVTTRSAARPSEVTEVIVVEPTAEEIRAEQIRKQREDIDALKAALAENRAHAEGAAERSSAQTRQAQSEIRALQAKLAEIAQDAEAADTRSEAEKLQAQSEIRALQAQLGEVRARADSAAAQSDKAFAIATEFLSNLVAAREEQRSIVERNINTFGGMEQRLAEIENRISETRQLSQAEIEATRTHSSALEQRLSESDSELTALREQLLQVHKQNEETRASLDSGPMLNMLRQLEGTQRDTSGLRGAFEEMQHEQEAARKRMQNYYLDLDARIQALQAKERAAREAELANSESLDDDSILVDDAIADGDESVAADDAIPPAEDTPLENSSADDSMAQELAVPDDADVLPTVLPTVENTVQSLDSEEFATVPDAAPTVDATGDGGVDSSSEAVSDPELQADQNEIGNNLPDMQLDAPDETVVEILPDSTDTENVSSADISAIETISDDLEVQADQIEMDASSSQDLQMEVRVELSADALPDIVDTVDIVPGEPVSVNDGALEPSLDDVSPPANDLSDEFNSVEPEASLRESDQIVALAPPASSTDVDEDAGGEAGSALHAVMITDWSAEY